MCVSYFFKKFTSQFWISGALFLSLKKCMKKTCLAWAQGFKAYLNVAYGFKEFLLTSTTFLL